jgi:hypothetical protein
MSSLAPEDKVNMSLDDLIKAKRAAEKKAPKKVFLPPQATRSHAT